MSEEFNNLLEEVKGLRQNILFYSPTKDKNYSISALNLKQQKLIIENTISSSLNLIFFNITFFNIIKDNFFDSIDNLDTIDRVNISLSLRSAIQDDYEIDDKKVSIKKILENNKEKIDFGEEVIETDDYKFTVRPPNLVIDNKVNELILNKYKNKQIDDNNLKSVISDLYVYEIIKFVKSVEIGMSEVTFNVEDNFNNSIKLFNEIDSVNFKQILRYINKLRDIELSLTKIPETEENISITPDFFIVQ